MVYTANVRIKDLPRNVDDALNAIASARRCHKTAIIRQALLEFVQNHAHEIGTLAAETVKETVA